MLFLGKGFVGYLHEALKRRVGRGGHDYVALERRGPSLVAPWRFNFHGEDVVNTLGLRLLARLGAAALPTQFGGAGTPGEVSVFGGTLRGRMRRL